MPPLTRPLTSTIKEQIEESNEFRRGFLREGIACLLTGDVRAGKLILHDYIEATLGFEEIGQALGQSADAIKRQFDLESETSLESFFQVVAHLQKHAGTVIEVTDHAA